MSVTRTERHFCASSRPYELLTLCRPTIYLPLRMKQLDDG
jgi:hypothetical protein